MTAHERRELIELWLTANEGAASDAQLEELSARIASDGDARAAVVEVSQHQGWLTWHASSVRLPAAYSQMATGAVDVDTAAPNGGLSGDNEAGGEHVLRRTSSNGGWKAAGDWPREWRPGRLAAAMVIGCLAGYFASQWAASWNVPADRGANRPTPIQATLVSGTGCVWGPGYTFGAIDDRQFGGGDSLQLLEGIAEFKIRFGASDVRLQMEGPASVVLTARGTPTLSYGKIIVSAEGPLPSAYAIETSFGRVLIESEAEIGLASFGSTGEVHCFLGSATLESPWLQSEPDAAASVLVAAGEAVHMDDVGDAALKATHGPAQRGRFTLQTSMTTDFLAVGSEYVRAISQSRPVAYWRFEDERGGIVRNEMGDRFHGRLKGKVQWVGPEGNRAIEFGVTPEPGSLIVAESWDEVLDGDFSLEAWIKPSHYHLGSIIGFIGEFDWQERRNKHGVLVEVNGTSQPSGIHQPQRLRFLHRATLGGLGGVSCFSDRPYQPRRWQHVAAVRQGDQLRLYLDGALVQQGEDSARMPLGLQLVMGQLYTETVERFFIGHVDEVAVYDRALEPEDVRRHHDLLRPGKAAADVL